MMMSCICLVTCLGLGMVCCQDMNNNKAYRDPLLSGLIFTDNLLYERSVTSTIHCASLCLKTDRCVTFTFKPVTSSDDVCRGHSARMNSSLASETSVGTSLYAFRKVKAEDDWLDKPCAAAQDCSQSDSRCRRDKCTCTQGYYYSVSTKACLESCSTDDLQDSYLPYPGGKTWDGAGMVLFEGITVEECRQACTDESACLFVEHRDYDGLCVLETVNVREKQPSVWDDDAEGWTYDQRNCR